MLGEIVVPVKMPVTRYGTKRPREPSLQLVIDGVRVMCRIGGRLGGGFARIRGADGEIPLLTRVPPNFEGRTLTGG